MFYLYTLLWLFSFAGLLVLTTRRRFEMVMLPGLTAAVFVLYVFSFFGQLKAGFCLLVALGALFWILLAVFFLRKQKESLKEFFDNYAGIGSAAFLIGTLWFFLLYHNRGFSNCDEFMHWGPMVIESLKNNGFYLTGEILKVHNDYPPFLTLLKVLFCGFNGFLYSEKILYIAQSVFYLSIFLPLFSSLRRKDSFDWLKGCMILISVFLAGLLISKTQTAQEWALMYNSVYADWVLATLAGGTLFYAYRYDLDVFNTVSLVLLLSAILLSKQIGICFYMLIVFLLAGKILLKKEKKGLPYLLTVIIVPLLMMLSWSLLIKSRGISGQFVVGNISFGEAVSQAFISGSYANGIAGHFLHELVFRAMLTHPFDLPYFVVSAILILLMLAVKRRQGILPAVTYLIGVFGYALTILLLYMTSFGADEAVVLASYDRYMISYLFFGMVFVICLLLDSIRTPLLFLVFPLCLLPFVETSSLKDLLPQRNIVQNQIDVLLVDPYDEFFYDREELSGLYFIFHDSKIHAENDPSLFPKELAENDLVYIREYDDQFYHECWPQQLNENEPYTRTIYSIQKENEGFRLEPLTLHFYDYVIRYYQIPKN